MSGPVAPFDPGVELAAYRIVQEALTNARRHAPGAAVDVELRYSGDRCGCGSGTTAPARPSPAARRRAGHGLLGMRERAATVGGSLRTGPPPAAGSWSRPSCPPPSRRRDRRRPGDDAAAA